MPLAQAFARFVTYPAWDFKDRSDRMREFGRLQRSQFASATELQRLQLERLKSIVAHAYAQCPLYRRTWRSPPRIASLTDLQVLPTLGKADVRSHLDELLARDHPRASLIEAKTGGSTGRALVVYFDECCQQWRNAAALRSDHWAGWRPGMWTAALWGTPPVARTAKEKVRNLLHDRIFFLDTMNLNDVTMEAFVAEMRRRHARALFGHAHSLYLFARFVLECKLPVPRLAAVMSTSMMLLEHERAVIEQAFGCRVGNRYGCEEVGLIAAECERHRGLHVNAEHVIVELLRADGSYAAPGEEAEIVVTDLINRGMPLIRYRIEDIGIAAQSPCGCGRGLPLIEKVIGRVADFLVRRDGSFVAGVSLVEKTVTVFPGVEQLQIVQESLDVFVLNLVMGPGYDRASEAGLRGVIHEQFGADVEVRISDLRRIPQERNGKYRFAVCNVPGSVS
jgi:phenylacetate-CoA ligase